MIQVMEHLAKCVRPGAMMGGLSMEGGKMQGGIALNLKDDPSLRSIRQVGFIRGNVFLSAYVTTHGDSGRLTSVERAEEHGT